MYPTITSALAHEHREDLLRQAEAAHRARVALRYRDRAADPVRPRRIRTAPILIARGWLARGML